MLPLDFTLLPLRPLDEIAVDRRVLLFTFAVSGVTTVLFGIAPAVTAARGNVRDALKEGGRESKAAGGNFLRRVLVASEVGLALVVLVGAGLTIKSMAKLVAVDPGFDPKNVLTRRSRSRRRTSPWAGAWCGWALANQGRGFPDAP